MLMTTSLFGQLHDILPELLNVGALLAITTTRTREWIVTRILCGRSITISTPPPASGLGDFSRIHVSCRTCP